MHCFTVLLSLSHCSSSSGDLHNHLPTIFYMVFILSRLSRGCGLEFKKHFAKNKANCATIIEAGPILWPTLIASNAIPN